MIKQWHMYTYYDMFHESIFGDKTMNKPTERAYLFFSGDPQAAKAVAEMIDTGKPAAIIAEWLKEYMSQLDVIDHIRIYNELMVPVIEATAWDEVANVLLNDAYNIDPCGSAVCMPEWECEDLQ